MAAELEAKLALPAAVYWLLRDDPGQLGLAIIRRSFERQDNLFYDTPTGALRRAGAVLRARRVAGRPGVEWTLKTARRLEDGVQVAEEASAIGAIGAIGPCGDDPLRLAGLLEPVVAARRLADDALRLDAASITDRTVLAVRMPSGGEIEVALDRLRIPGDPVFVDYELEAEARGATRAEVVGLAADLAGRFGLMPSTQPKRARLQSFADGRLGSPRVAASVCIPSLLDEARRRASVEPVRVRLQGLTGAPIPQLIESLRLEVEQAGLAGELRVSDFGWPAPGESAVRVFVGSSVHWRLLRHLVSGHGSGDGPADLALDSFRQATETRDRRLVEGQWREADLIVYADDVLIARERFEASSPGAIYRPEDLPPEVGATVALEPIGGRSRLRFSARAWPSDLGALLVTAFELGVGSDPVARTLVDLGYREG